MALAVDQARRFARQIALPEIGPDGQERLLRARVVVVRAAGETADDAACTAATYLAAAGVMVETIAPPPDGDAWMTALAGAVLALRFDFDDDALLRAAVNLGVPTIFTRARRDGIEMLSFRKHGPCPHAELGLPTGSADRDPQPGAAAVVAGTLAASEALFILLSPAAPPRARLLRLPLDGQAPLGHELPWAPECFLCGGHGREANLTRA